MGMVLEQRVFGLENALRQALERNNLNSGYPRDRHEDDQGWDRGYPTPIGDSSGTRINTFLEHVDSACNPFANIPEYKRLPRDTPTDFPRGHETTLASAT